MQLGLKLILAYFIGMNLLTLILYGVDKAKAKARAWRIPEKVLLGFAALGGSIGAWSGMYLFHHKTKKLKFSLGVPVILIAQIALAVYLYMR